MGDNLRSLIFKYEDGKASLSVLDQLLLPHETKYVPVENVEDAWDAVSCILLVHLPFFLSSNYTTAIQYTYIT